MDIHAVPGKLKLKKGGVTKKKRKEKPKLPDESDDVELEVEVPKRRRISEEMPAPSDPAKAHVDSHVPTTEDDESAPPVRTKAELSFAKRQEELRLKRVMEKAKISHRERVEEFNKKMNEMTEFNDIPKVSWTK